MYIFNNPLLYIAPLRQVIKHLLVFFPLISVSEVIALARIKKDNRSIPTSLRAYLLQLKKKKQTFYYFPFFLQREKFKETSSSTVNQRGNDVEKLQSFEAMKQCPLQKNK